MATAYPGQAMPPVRTNGGKSSPLAEVVAAATLEEPRYPLEEQVEVVGETYRAKDIRRVFEEAGMPITESGVTLKSVRCILVPEPWNEHDPNAVAVMVGQNHVGYLAADLAASYTDGLLSIARLGSLATGEARIWAKSDDGIIRARVTILIPEASQFD
ncbi:HIRAN domain-containing protein [Mycobacterium colombiense]|uniref:HIRAN domain-containing protein n=1 Tax=Mycobacterium colombiense TaxID=339268 RepID=UPI001E4B636F|nr:HIRAN domain-containing protein [Mycobacterium colombiense]